MSQEFNPSRQELKQLLRVLKKGLRIIKREELAARTPCPDSWTMASYVAGQLDQSTQETLNAHVAFCKSCFEDYVALAGPEKIARILLRQEPAQGASLEAAQQKGSEYHDQVLKCVDCRSEFVFTAGEQMFFDDKGWKEKPKRCKSCRAKRVAALDQEKGSQRKKTESAGVDRPRKHLEH